MLTSLTISHTVIGNKVMLQVWKTGQMPMGYKAYFGHTTVEQATGETVEVLNDYTSFDSYQREREAAEQIEKTGYYEGWL